MMCETDERQVLLTVIFTSCMHITIAPVFFTQLFKGAVGRVEGEQFG